MRKRTIIFIYLLSCYIFLQFVWWGYHLFQLNEQILGEGEGLNKKYLMILGEGLVFFSILLFGIVQLMRSVKKEIALNRQKKNFLLSVTHELKTPLASIKLNLQTLKKRELERSTQQELLGNSESEIARLENIVNNILAVTRLENSNKVMETIDFNLSELFQKQIDGIRLNFGSKHQINEEVEKDIKYNGDPGVFGLILSNLLENAIKYSPKNSKITIVLRKVNDQIEFSVIDKGIGISKMDKGKIFDKFYRSGNEEVRSAKGTGLGLFLVKNLVGELKGSITVITEENKGTEIKITI